MKQTELFSTGCFNTSPPRSVLVRPRLCIRLSLVDYVTLLGLGFQVRGLSTTEITRSYDMLPGHDVCKFPYLGQVYPLLLKES